MAKFEILQKVKHHSNRGSRGYNLSNVSYGEVSGVQYLTMMNTPNEKFDAVIHVLCAALGITTIEYKLRQVHNNFTYCYRIMSTDPTAPYYNTGDFAVVLASMMSKRLASGETLQK